MKSTKSLRGSKRERTRETPVKDRLYKGRDFQTRSTLTMKLENQQKRWSILANVKIIFAFTFQLSPKLLGLRSAKR